MAARQKPTKTWAQVEADFKKRHICGPCDDERCWPCREYHRRREADREKCARVLPGSRP